MKYGVAGRIKEEGSEGIVVAQGVLLESSSSAGLSTATGSETLKILVDPVDSHWLGVDSPVVGSYKLQVWTYRIGDADEVGNVDALWEARSHVVIKSDISVTIPTSTVTSTVTTTATKMQESVRILEYPKELSTTPLIVEYVLLLYHTVLYEPL